MALPTDDIVKVTSSLLVATASPDTFNTLAIVEPSDTLPLGARQQTFENMTQVVAVFSAASAAYAAAAIAFSQNPSADAVTICRRLAAAAPGELLGGQEPVTLLATYAAIANGALELEVNGTAVDLTNVSFAGVQSLDAVANIVQGKMAAVVPGSTCAWNGFQFVLQSGTTGPASSVQYTGVAPAGTDLAPLLGLRPADGAVQSAGAVAESVAQSLTNLNQGTPLPYMVQLTSEATAQNLLDAGAWCLANKRVYVYTELEPAALNTGDQTTVAYQFKQQANAYAFGQFALPTDPYACTSIASRMLAVDLTQPNSATIAKFKQEPGVNTLSLTETQKAALEALNLNYYTLYGSTPVFAEGTMADGTWFDTRQALDFAEAGIQSSIFTYLASQNASSSKTPYTDAGMAACAQQVEIFLDQLQAAGVLAANVWNGPALGRATTGAPLPGGKGYYVYWPPVANQTQAQRNSRVGPPMTIYLTGAGAIQGLNIALTYQQ